MRSKLQLNLDQLEVDTFQTVTTAGEARGTVQANDDYGAQTDSGYEFCTINDATCRGYGTCGKYPCKPVP
ncbi:hypothetical protein [Longimicrobium terrae]|uniref:Uncharacterized protein n=1 Tax=Longimicrobium terrae TaxID=1639882 RepID=A0A841H5A7_9BACT|nr:hypothetical protein [Longimicrobium terrae]MBB4638919.1 hypothetical protein [Longimicrobium terrae]MBB6073158.1 hypothetical protein [Longimicrobium terrae]NNC30156.1 hypothetical protein [Longimicrobium terrae]